MGTCYRAERIAAGISVVSRPPIVLDDARFGRVRRSPPWGLATQDEAREMCTHLGRGYTREDDALLALLHRVYQTVIGSNPDRHLSKREPRPPHRLQRHGALRDRPGRHRGPGGKVDALKYQHRPAASSATASGELLTIKIRYKAPDATTSKLLSRPVKGAPLALAKTSTDFHRGGYDLGVRHVAVRVAVPRQPDLGADQGARRGCGGQRRRRLLQGSHQDD